MTQSPDAVPTATTATTTTAKAAAWPRKARGALLRYRIMAWATGAMLLLLTLDVILKYVLHANGVAPDGTPNEVIGAWVARTHGFFYIVYLVTVFDLWSTMRWRLGRLATLAAAGVVPVMSFILERKVHAQAVARIAAAVAAQG